MAVSKPKNSKYYHCVITVNGKTKRGSTKTQSKKLALEVEREWREQLVRETSLGQGEEITFGDAIDNYIRSQTRSGTIKNLQSALKRFDFDRSAIFHTITPAQWSRSFHEQRRTLTDNSLRNSIVALKGVIRVNKDLGYLVPQVKMPKLKQTRGRLRFLTDDEVGKLLDELRPDEDGRLQDAHDLVVLLLHTGARYSEIANIEWNQIDFANRQIRLFRPKVANESLLRMDSTVHQLLTRRWANRKSDDHVFTNRAGGPRGYAGIAIRRAIKRAGLEDVTIHTLRHTHASKLAQAGFSLQEIGQVLGHANINTTMRYAHLIHSDVMDRVASVFEPTETQSTNVAAIR